MTNQSPQSSAAGDGLLRPVHGGYPDAKPKPGAACANCNDKLWVCENHPSEPNWEECCGVGMMCGICCREEIIRAALFQANGAPKSGEVGELREVREILARTIEPEMQATADCLRRNGPIDKYLWAEGVKWVDISLRAITLALAKAPPTNGGEQ